ncbi:MAG: tRNA lysidine(34) synthetase TilS [Planctomycetes bacterium]|nr:tRNA lysidine(34) synthetase TilS [Planctomycetota bacterium]
MDRDRQLPFPPPADAARTDARGAFAPQRWATLAHGVGLAPEEPLVLALSGGADSVFLLHVLAAARPRPRVFLVHVDHGLRGSESDGDAAFCTELAHAAGFPIEVVRVDLDPAPSDLEQRARVARYAALARAAERLGAAAIATGHHADDSLETLLLRWTRGAQLGGFRGVPARTVLAPSRGADALNPTRTWLRIVRPLHALRREEVREALRAAGHAWREDSSNASALHSRNRVRHALLPALRAACAPDALANLAEFARSVEDLEAAFARTTAELAWGPPRYASARRGPAELALGGSLERARLARLPEPLLRRAFVRLVAEGTGRMPRRAAQDRALAALQGGRTGEVPLHGGWMLALRSDWVHLDPPRGPAGAGVHAMPRRARNVRAGERQLLLPFEDAPGDEPADPRPALALALPGALRLADGRVLSAEFVDLAGTADLPRGTDCVELDASGLPPVLAVRAPLPGDRFHPLGAPGSRPLTRFLRDAGLPRRDRDRVALVYAAEELLWVAGIRPAEPRRVGPATRRRLRLSLTAG